MKKIASIDKKERYAKNEHTLNIRYVCKDHGENANALKAVNPCNMLIVGSHQYFRPLQLIFCEIIDFTPYAPQINTLYLINGDVRYIFLDEIQNIDGWPLFVNRLLRKKMHVVLTGSNAKLLSSDLATHLTGRSHEIALYPFSFADYCNMQGVNLTEQTTKAIATRRRFFDIYLQKGGFPELLLVKDSRQYIMGLINNILKRDIEQRYRIAYTAQFEALAHHLLSVSPSIVSLAELTEIFDFKSNNTLRNYIDYLKQAYILLGVSKFSPKSKMRVVGEKLYAVDVALMNNRPNAFVGENLGWRLETIVLCHLIRLCNFMGWDVYYLRERSVECDFVVCQGNRVVQCIQVSYDISSTKTKTREINGLLMAHRKTHCTNLLLLTDYETDTVEKEGLTIQILPVHTWCASLPTIYSPLGI